jgi:hypothetical protein
MVIAVLLIAAAGCSKSTKTASGAATTAATVTTAPAVATTAGATTLPGAVTTAPAGAATTAPAGSATTAPATSGLTGAWPGEWQNTTPDSSRGTFRIQWTQSGSSLSGTIAITGTPCLTGGSISGSLNGGNLNFGVVTGQAQVSYTGTVSGTTMSGTYTTSCGNAQGTWKATKA